MDNIKEIAALGFCKYYSDKLNIDVDIDEELVEIIDDFYLYFKEGLKELDENTKLKKHLKINREKTIKQLLKENKETMLVTNYLINESKELCKNILRVNSEGGVLFAEEYKKYKDLQIVLDSIVATQEIAIKLFKNSKRRPDSYILYAAEFINVVGAFHYYTLCLEAGQDFNNGLRLIRLDIIKTNALIVKVEAERLKNKIDNMAKAEDVEELDADADLLYI